MAGDGTIWIKMAVKGASDVQRELATTGTSVKNFGKAAEDGGKSAAGFGVSIGALAIGAAGAAVSLHAMMLEAGQLADEMLDLSERTGIAAGKLKALRDETIANGGEFNQVSMGLDMFTRTLGESGEAGEKFRKKLSELGVTTSGKTYSQVLDETIKKLQGIEDPATKAATAAELFGTKAYREIIDLGPKANDILGDTAAKYNKVTQQMIIQKQYADAWASGVNTVITGITTGAVDIWERTIGGWFTGGMRTGRYAEYLQAISDASTGNMKTSNAFMAKYIMTTEEYAKSTQFAAEQQNYLNTLQKYGDQNVLPPVIDKTEKLTDANTKLAESTKEVAKTYKDVFGTSNMGGYRSELEGMTKDQLLAKLSGATWSGGGITSYAAGRSKSEQDTALMMYTRMGGTDTGSNLATESPEAKTANEATNKVSEYTGKQVESAKSASQQIQSTYLEMWQRLSAMERIYYETLMKHHYDSTDYISRTVQYIQQIVVFNGQPQASPQTYVTAAPPELAPADYSSVSSSVAAGVKDKEAAAKEAASAAAAAGATGGADYSKVVIEVKTSDTLAAQTVASEGVANVVITGGNV